MDSCFEIYPVYNDLKCVLYRLEISYFVEFYLYILIVFSNSQVYFQTPTKIIYRGVGSLLRQNWFDLREEFNREKMFEQYDASSYSDFSGLVCGWYIFIYVCTCRCSGVREVHVRGREQLWVSLQWHLCPCFWDRVSHWSVTRHLYGRPGCLGSDPHGSVYSAFLPSTGITSCLPPHLAFIREVLGVKVKTSVL